MLVKIRMTLTEGMSNWINFNISKTHFLNLGLFFNIFKLWGTYQLMNVY